MPKQIRTNADRIVSAVLDDAKLSEYGNYSPYDYPDIETAEMSENTIVATVAKIVKGVEAKKSDTVIYNEVSNYLKLKI